MIKKEGNQFCLYTKDGSKKLGCFPSEEKAKEREREVQFFKARESGEPEDVWLTVEEMRELCPECADRMIESNLTKVNLSRIEEQGNIQSLIGFFRKKSDPGMFTKCTSVLKNKSGITDADSLCAWMHKQATGKFPAQHESENFENLTESIQLLESKDGSVWDVVLIEQGLSVNDTDYSNEEVLREAIPLFEGAKAYAPQVDGKFDHLEKIVPGLHEANPGGFPKAVVGWFDIVRYGEFPKTGGEKGKGLLAKFHVLDESLKRILFSAWKKGKKDLLGLSINAVGDWVKRMKESKIIREITKILQVDSVDVVTNPAAGGRLINLVESQSNLKNKLKESQEMKELLTKLKQQYEKILEAINPEAEDSAAEVEKAFKLIAESQKPTTDPSKETDKKDGNVLSAEQVQKMVEAAKTKPEEIAKIVTETVDAIHKKQDQNRQAVEATKTMLEAKIVESKLPKIVADEARDECSGKILTEAEILQVLKRKQKLAASLQESGINYTGQNREAATVGDEDYDKYVKAFTAMLLNQREIDGIPAFRGLHESYQKIVGFAGNAKQIGRKLLMEASVALPPLSDDSLEPQEDFSIYRKRLQESRESNRGRLSEAQLDTTLWAEVYGDSVRRALIKRYDRVDLQEWRKIVSNNASVPDFRTNRRIRVGGFGNLSIVAQGGTYQFLDYPTDQEVTYAVRKRGALTELTMESMVNDDLGAVRLVPQMLGTAAAQTLYEFVFDFLKDNVTLDYDTTALFHANHGNLGSTALSDAALDDRIFAMLEQTEQDSGKPLNKVGRPRYIVGPAELFRAAWEVSKASVSSQGARTETLENWFKTFGIDPIVVTYWTDANNWYLVSDPSMWPTIEIGFLNGQETPEIFIQDQPTIGSNFTADKITYKIRHIYDGDVLDHRSFDGSVVT